MVSGRSKQGLLFLCFRALNAHFNNYLFKYFYEMVPRYKLANRIHNIKHIFGQKLWSILLLRFNFNIGFKPLQDIKLKEFITLCCIVNLDYFSFIICLNFRDYPMSITLKKKLWHAIESSELQLRGCLATII